METLDLCIATYGLNKGNGIDITVAEFAGELSKYHNVEIAVISSDMTVPGVDIVRYKASRPWQWHGVAKELDSKKFDIISTHYLPFDVVASMAKTTHFLHDYGVAPLSSLMNNMGEFMLWNEFQACSLIAARKADMYLPISDYLRKGFVKRYRYKGPSEILPAGITFPDKDPGPAGKEFGRYVLFVGRHTPYKGVDKLIRIFGEARKELDSDVHLVTIGRIDRGYEKVLMPLAEKAGNVHILGFVPDIWAYHAGATVYATCSAWEGEDRPAIEAQYMRKPVISFNNCSHPEVVTYGTLANSEAEFKDAIIRHITDHKEDPSVREKMVSRFSTGNIAKRYIEIAKGV